MNRFVTPRRVIVTLLSGLLLTFAAPMPGFSSEGDNPHGAFKEDCGLCHRPEAWTPVVPGKQFDHARRGFALEGAHARAACRACHLSLEFTRTGVACVDCHQDVHKGEMGADCARCHTTRNFIDQADQRRNHRLTRFPLTGAHAAVDCDSCHAPAPSGQLQFVNTRSDCEACHLEDYLSTSDPDHSASAFPRDCVGCHSVVRWSGSQFNHDVTGFPLAGSHRSLDCSACHTGNQFQGASPDCYSCHRADYDQSVNPAHQPAGFPQDCQSCHSTDAWRPARFDHGQTAFPLTGAHRGLDCQQCHGSGIFTGTSTACISCHQSDYDGTSNPNHAAAGFTTDCAACHDSSGWSGATFDHDSRFFPIYSGAHAGRWASCSTCHTNPASYADFTCLVCHPHSDKTGTDGHHSGVSGYSYVSSACYNCHPRGSH